MGIAFALISGSEFSHATASQNAPAVTQRTMTAFEAILELFKIAGGVIGMFGVALGIFGGYLAFRAAQTKAHVANAEKTAQIYENQNKALRHDYELQAEKLTILDTEASTLRRRTDISGVLDIIKQIQETGNTRWAMAMDVLTTQNKTQLEALAKNHQLLVGLGTNIGKLTDKFTAVEHKIDARAWDGEDRRRRQLGPPDGRERRLA